MNIIFGRVTRLRAGKPSRYIASHLGQLSLAIPPWVGAVSSSLRVLWGEGLVWLIGGGVVSACCTAVQWMAA